MKPLKQKTKKAMLNKLDELRDINEGRNITKPREKSYLLFKELKIGDKFMFVESGINGIKVSTRRYYCPKDDYTFTVRKTDILVKKGR